MNRRFIPWLMLLALTFYVSGAAQFAHEEVDHSARRATDRTPAAGPAAADSQGQHCKPNNPLRHSQTHDACTLCQMLAGMHFAAPTLAPLAARHNAVPDFVSPLSLLHPAAPTCEGPLLPRPPPFLPA